MKLKIQNYSILSETASPGCVTGYFSLKFGPQIMTPIEFTNILSLQSFQRFHLYGTDLQT